MRTALAATAAALVVAALPATAQPPAEIDLRFERVSPWTAPDRPLEIAVTLSNRSALPLENPSIGVSVYGRVLSRSELRAALDGRPRSSLIATVTEDLAAPLQAGATQRVAVTRDLGQLATSFRPPRARGGVYPIEIRLQDDRRILSRWFTAVPFFSRPPPQQLNVAWIWSVHRPPAFDADGKPDPAALEASLRRSGLARAAAALARTSVRATVAVTGSLLDSASAGAAGSPLASDLLAGLRALAESPSVELAALPYGRADLTALAGAGLDGDVARQMSESADTAARVLGRRPDLSLLAPPGFRLDPRAATLAAPLGVRRVILDPALLPPIEDQALEGALFGPSRPVRVSAAPGVAFDALLVDPEIRERLRGPGDPVLVAQGVLAETASSFFELPLLASARVIVVASDVLPGSRTAIALLRSLTAAPWIRMRTVGEAFSSLQSEEAPLPLAPAGALPELPYLAAARAARRAVDVARAVVVGPAAGIDALDRLILDSESADWSIAPAGGVAIAETARRKARDFLGTIRAPDRQVTLTSRRGALPVTVVNGTGLEIRLRVRLSSVKATFPAGESRLLETGARIATLEFPAVARATGSFPVTVLLQTVGGETIATGRVVVRSTAVGAVALAATGGGALFLLGAWVRRVLRRRRARPATTNPLPGPRTPG
ncbi:MAG: hypothetical protein HY775_01895 [Acidobacteria bacterium]|nr:hypothetical protein [Acidobacteriota bacterium]